jgi:hypothetical protein
MGSRKNDGTPLQDKLAKALKTYSEYHPAYWHRFPDTKSAGGNYLQAQPGDYLLAAPVGVILIECKSTVVGARVLTLAHHGTVGKNQIAKHRLWHRAGQPSAYLWGDMVKEQIEWHWGFNVVKKIDKPILIADLKGLGSSIATLISLVKDTYHAAAV